jgi:predicted Zn finger-like uncharacterized protein
VNFSCDRCGRHYSIADEKVQGRQFRVACKACGNTIHVRAGGAPVVTPAPRAPAPAPRAPAPTPPPSPPPRAAVAAAPPPPPAAPPPPSDTELDDLFAAAAPPGPRALDDDFAVAAPPEPPALEDLFAAAAPPEPPALDDDFGGAEPPPMPAPGMSDAELAWLSAEAPAAPPPDAPVADAPLAPDAPRPAGRRRLALVAGGAVALVAAATVAGFLLLRKPAAPPRPPIAAAPAPAPAPKAEPTPPPAAEPPAAAEPQAADPAPAPVVAGPVAAAGPTVTAPRVVRGDPREKRTVRIASKDRKLLDLLDKKGDAAPAAPVQVATLDTGKSALDAAQVQQTIRDNHGAFAACITKAIKADPKLKVTDRRATLMLTIRPDGVVSGAWIAEADLESSRLGRCLVSAARRVVFPAFQGETIDVAAPLALSAVR